MRKQPAFWRTLRFLFLGFFVLISIGPLLWIVMSSFKTNREILSSAFAPPTSFSSLGPGSHLPVLWKQRDHFCTKHAAERDRGIHGGLCAGAAQVSGQQLYHLIAVRIPADSHGGASDAHLQDHDDHWTF